MFLSVLYLNLIYLSHSLIYAQNVLEWEPYAIGYQMDFLYHKEEKAIASSTIEIKSASGHAFTLKCNVYEDEDTKVDIYNEFGLFIETLILAPTDDNPCDETALRNYITPQEDEIGKVTMVYLWSGKTRKCATRFYQVHEFPFLATVESSDYPRVSCPDTVNEYVQSFSGGTMQGGILTVGPPGRNHVLDYNAHVKTRGTPTTLEFPTEDLKGKKFKLICREDILLSENPESGQNTITTGSIVHQDNEDIVIEKFRMTTCNLDGINVNRQIVNNQDRYKIVFKTAFNDCFEREYELFDVLNLYYYNHVSIFHFWPIKVKCPDSFVGDVDVNAHRPWYKRFFKKFFKPNPPYAVEY